MKLLISLYNLLSEVVKIATSKERLKGLIHVPLYSNALYLMAASVVSALLGFVFWMIATRFYSAEDIGLASAAISAVSLLAMLANFGLGYGLIRFLPQSGKNASSMINSCLTLGILASVVLAVIFLGGLGFWSPALLFIRDNSVYLAAFIIFTLVFTLSTLTEQAFVAERRASFVLAKSLIFNLLRLPLPILLAAFFHSFGIFASWGISLGVALLFSVFFLLPRAQPGYRPFITINRRIVNDILHFSFANYLSIFFWAAPNFVLPIMMVNLLGGEPNAYFYIAWATGSILTMIPTAVSTSLFVEGSYEEKKLGLNIQRSLKMVFLIHMPAVILIVVFADKLLLLFGSSYSENATTLLRILSISSLPLAINIIYLAIKRVEKKLRIIIGLTAFIAVATLGLTYFLLPHMGINGAGIAWLISQGIVALVIVASWFKRRQANMKVNGPIF